MGNCIDDYRAAIVLFYNLYQKRIESLNKANKKGIFGGNPSNGHITSLNYNYNTNKIIKL
jgi:hypothetical protein